MNSKYTRHSFVIITHTFGNPQFLFKGSNCNVLTGFTTDITKARRFRSWEDADEVRQSLINRNYSESDLIISKLCLSFELCNSPFIIDSDTGKLINILDAEPCETVNEESDDHE